MGRGRLSQPDGCFPRSSLLLVNIVDRGRDRRRCSSLFIDYRIWARRDQPRQSNRNLAQVTRDRAEQCRPSHKVNPQDSHPRPSQNSLPRRQVSPQRRLHCPHIRQETHQHQHHHRHHHQVDRHKSTPSRREVEVLNSIPRSSMRSMWVTQLRSSSTHQTIRLHVQNLDQPVCHTNTRARARQASGQTRNG